MQNSEIYQIFEPIIFSNIYEREIRAQPLYWQYPFIEIIAGTHNFKISRTKEFLKAQELFITSIKYN